MPETDELDFIFNESSTGLTLVDYLGKDEIVKIPAEVDGKKVARIGYAFYECTTLKYVSIPNSVTDILGETYGGAFRKCINLRSVTIPDSVTNIGNYAFA